MAALMKEESSDKDLNGDIDDKFCIQSETESTHNSEDTRTPSLQSQQDITQPDRMSQEDPCTDVCGAEEHVMIYHYDDHFAREELPQVYPLRGDPCSDVYGTMEYGITYHCDGHTKEIRPQDNPYKNFTTFDAALGIVSIVLFYVDVVTDIMLANEYFHQGHKLWFGLTTTFIVVPSIIICIIDLLAYVANTNKGTSTYLWVIRLTMTLLMMGPVIRQIEYLYLGLKSRGKEKKNTHIHYKKTEIANNVVCHLRMFECVLEAAPQLVLQIYILTSQRQHESWHTGGRQVAAILSSFVGLAWSTVAFEKAGRLFYGKENHTLKGLVFLFLCRASEIGPRVIALGLFASQFHSFVFIVTGVHFISMSIWFILMTGLSVENIFLNLLYGIAFIFCFLEYGYRIKKYNVLVYYIIVVLENFIMVGFWSYFTDAKGEWFYIPTFFVMPLGLVLWLFFVFMYFGYFHPSGKRRIPFFHQMGINSCYPNLCHAKNDENNTI